MKCKLCGKKIFTRPSRTEISVNGKTVKVINIPAFYCESCDREYFHEIVLQKAKNYAYRKNLPDILDYAAFEDEVSEDMLGSGLFYHP